MRNRLPLAAAVLALCTAVGAQAQTAAPALTTAPAPAGRPDAGAAFLADMARQAGVVTLPSGLEYKVVQSGPSWGLSPSVGQEVQVAYEGKLMSGAVFDTAPADSPASLTVGELVPAWNEALVRMRPGDEWMLYVKPSLGYGERGAGPIPANSVLVFRLKLLSVGPLQ